MAITAYTGLPGSGKSYGVVKYVIIPALQKGRRVWTNIPLVADHLTDHEKELVTQFEVSDIQDSPNWFDDVFEPGATLVIDEVWDLWPAGLKATNILDSHKSLLAKHRHMVGEDGNSTEIVLVTQDLAQIAAYPRSLVETTYRSVKLVAVGRTDNYRIDIYTGPATGPNPPEKSRLRQLFGKYEPEVYKYYQSQTMSATGEHGDETRTDSRTNILASPYMKFGIPFAILFGIWVLWYGLSEVSSMYAGETDPVATTEPVIAPGATNLPSPLEPKKNKESRFRHFYEGMKAYIAFNNGRYPWVDFLIAFTDGESRVTMRPDELGQLGYQFVAYDQCFAQLIGHGDILNLFCNSPSQESNSSQPLIDL